MEEALKKSLIPNIEKRLNSVLPLAYLTRLGVIEFWVAGNSLNLSESVNDVDLFFPEFPEDLKDTIESIGDSNWKECKGKSTYETNHALTLSFDKSLNFPPLQFCRHKRPTLEELVKSFDFAHVQIGAKVKIIATTLSGDHLEAKVKELFFTNEYISSNLSNSLQFVDSDFPIIAFHRLIKFIKRKNLNPDQYLMAFFQILECVIKKDFSSHCETLGAVSEELSKEIRDYITKNINPLLKTKTNTETDEVLPF